MEVKFPYEKLCNTTAGSFEPPGPQRLKGVCLNPIQGVVQNCTTLRLVPDNILTRYPLYTKFCVLYIKHNSTKFGVHS